MTASSHENGEKDRVTVTGHSDHTSEQLKLLPQPAAGNSRDWSRQMRTEDQKQQNNPQSHIAEACVRRLKAVNEQIVHKYVIFKIK